MSYIFSDVYISGSLQKVMLDVFSDGLYGVAPSFETIDRSMDW